MAAPNLAELEQRVHQKFMDARQVDWPLPDDPFDTSEWLAGIGAIDTVGVATTGTEQPILQFPREQWITYPARRYVILVLCDRMLDLAGELTEEHWTQLTFLLSFGGKERVA